MSPQWPLGLPPKDEKAQGYVIPSGGHYEWPLEPPKPLEPKESPRLLEPLEPKEPLEPQWPISLPEVSNES